jgi:DNA-binding response OmpR family regulator
MAKFLVVDDERSNLNILIELFQDTHTVLVAKDGHQALKRAFANEPPDVILLDIMMPGMDGFEVCRQLKADPRTSSIPIIFITARTEGKDIVHGLELGAYYYLTKPADPRTVTAVVSAALEEYRVRRDLMTELKGATNALGVLKTGIFQFRSLKQATNVSLLIAKACPDPESRVLGLTELMINAVEHGNLGISYAEKTHLVNEGTLSDEVAHRLNIPEYSNKLVNVTFERSRQAIQIHILDEGEGFEWDKYMTFDPERIFDPHGRGIAIANQMSFDLLQYQGRGNEVRLVINNPTPGEPWSPT